MRLADMRRQMYAYNFTHLQDSRGLKVVNKVKDARIAGSRRWMMLIESRGEDWSLRAASRMGS
jgi:hypothetical protein